MRFRDQGCWYYNAALEVQGAQSNFLAAAREAKALLVILDGYEKGLEADESGLSSGAGQSQCDSGSRACRSIAYREVAALKKTLFSCLPHELALPYLTLRASVVRSWRSNSRMAS